MPLFNRQRSSMISSVPGLCRQYLDSHGWHLDISRQNHHMPSCMLISKLSEPFRGSNGNEIVIHSHYLAFIVAYTLYLLSTSCSSLTRGPSLCFLPSHSVHSIRPRWSDSKHSVWLPLCLQTCSLLCQALSMCCVCAPVWGSTYHLAWFTVIWL